MRRVQITIGEQDLAKLDEMAAERGLSRSAAIRALLSGEVPSAAAADHTEAVLMLSESARAGSVQARIHLERALRDQHATGDPIDKLVKEILAA